MLWLPSGMPSFNQCACCRRWLQIVRMNAAASFDKQHYLVKDGAKFCRTDARRSPCAFEQRPCRQRKSRREPFVGAKNCKKSLRSSSVPPCLFRYLACCHGLAWPLAFSNYPCVSVNIFVSLTHASLSASIVDSSQPSNAGHAASLFYTPPTCGTVGAGGTSSIPTQRLRVTQNS